MFKKIIYSFMALSLTMLPAAQVMATDISGDKTINSGETVNLNSDGDTWTGGTITNNGGVLNISGLNYSVDTSVTPGVCTGNNCTTSKAPNYIQKSGSQLSIKSSGDASLAGVAGSLTLTGTNTTGAIIEGGTVMIGNTTNKTQGSSLILGANSSVASVASITINKSNNLTLNSATATLNLDSTDKWEGNIVLNN